MANYYGTFRTNYFEVYSKSLLEQFSRRWYCQYDFDSEGRACLYDESSSGIPSWAELTKEEAETLGDNVAPEDFYDELALLLPEDEVVIIMESGAEKARYVHGAAIAMNGRREKRKVLLNDIYEQANELTNNPEMITDCAY